MGGKVIFLGGWFSMSCRWRRRRISVGSWFWLHPWRGKLLKILKESEGFLL
jgi:hypothetical protein